MSGPEAATARAESGSPIRVFWVYRSFIWRSALHENATDPMTGTGPGTFQYWWNQHGNIPVFVQNAHSLYFETLGELGIIGLVLIAGFLVWVLARGATGALRGWPGNRSRSAAVTAAVAAFAAAAVFDWVWQIAVIPIALLLLAAVVLGADAREPRARRSAGSRRGRLSLRIGAGAAAVVAIIAIAIPLAATISVRASQGAFRGHNLSAALADARSAHSIEPYAATPLLQEAQVLELQKNLPAASAAARQATRAESTNWRTWLVRSRIEAERGRVKPALNYYRRARHLDPHSFMFQSFQAAAIQGNLPSGP